jgi:hypothetical protein
MTGILGAIRDRAAARGGRPDAGDAPAAGGGFVGQVASEAAGLRKPSVPAAAAALLIAGAVTCVAAVAVWFAVNRGGPPVRPAEIGAAPGARWTLAAADGGKGAYRLTGAFKDVTIFAECQADGAAVVYYLLGDDTLRDDAEISYSFDGGPPVREEWMAGTRLGRYSAGVAVDGEKASRFLAALAPAKASLQFRIAARLNKTGVRRDDIPLNGGSKAVAKFVDACAARRAADAPPGG